MTSIEFHPGEPTSLVFVCSVIELPAPEGSLSTNIDAKPQRRCTVMNTTPAHARSLAQASIFTSINQPATHEHTSVCRVHVHFSKQSPQRRDRGLNRSSRMLATRQEPDRVVGHLQRACKRGQ